MWTHTPVKCREWSDSVCAVRENTQELWEDWMWVVRKRERSIMDLRPLALQEAEGDRGNALGSSQDPEFGEIH